MPQDSSQYDPRARPKPFAFYPPKTNATLVRLAQWNIERTLRRKLHVTQVEISEEDLQRLRQLKDQRRLLAPSHSGGFEPHVMMYLSKLLGEEFNFVAAVELFEQSPINRWVMPRLGVYSICRGAVDRASFSMTRKLLAAGERPLVIFPEGHASFQNDTVQPFQQGVFQLAFKAYEDALKSDDHAQFYCVPIAIKYVYLQDMHAEIDASLGRIEAKLALLPDAKDCSRTGRLQRIVEAVVVANEKARQIKPSKDAALGDRIEHLKTTVVEQLERQLGVTPTADQPLLDRVRTLFNAVDRVVSEDPPESEYEQQLAAERQRAARTSYDDLWRLAHFATIYNGYVSESMTFERFLDVLSQLEMEMFQQRQVWGPRKACVKVGEPINLSDRLDDYRADKRESVKTIALELENSVRGMLRELGQCCRQVVDGPAEN